VGGKGRRHDRGLRDRLIELIDNAVDGGARIDPACRLLGLSARTVQRWQRAPKIDDSRAGPRTAPTHKLTDEEKDRIVQLVNEPEYRNLSPEQAIAKLADAGIYVCSERSLRRVLAERRLDRYRQRSKPAVAQNKPRQYAAREPLRVLSWDITYLRSSTIRGSYFYLYLFLDIWSRRIVGCAVHETQSAELAADVLRSLCDEHDLETEKLVVHSDNGAPMKGCTMLALMQSLSITASFSRPSVSDDNAFAEALFRHLKYAPSYPSKGFASLDEARDWVSRFVTWYNTQHLHSSIGLVTPDDRHHGRDIPILENRRSVYAAAQTRHPRRWTGTRRRWSRPAIVTLNPERIVLAGPRTRSDAA
jgi:transposase InsO family protein